jgi:hypothetical protein
MKEGKLNANREKHASKQKKPQIALRREPRPGTTAQDQKDQQVDQGGEPTQVVADKGDIRPGKGCHHGGWPPLPQMPALPENQE